ncbi:MAG: enoyl-CoA hydratase-related protein [Pseudomonadota bacterium]
MSETTVLWGVDARGVAEVTLNRPERNNAYNDALIAGLHAAVDALEGVDHLRAVVIRSAGRHFQAGADLTWLKSVRSGGAEANRAVSRATAEIVDRLNSVPAVTVALVNGACIGGGTGVLAACDVVIAEASATFAISEIRWGLTAAVIVPQLVDAIGVRQCRRYALTGERFDADEARRIGLVHEIVAEGDLQVSADRVLDAVLKGAPKAIAETKALIRSESRGAIQAAALTELIDAHADKRQSDEAGEGLAAFDQKRSPDWGPDR